MKKIILSVATCALVFSANAENVEIIETTSQGTFSDVYAGLGMGGNFLKDNGNRFIGTFVIGAGKQFRNNAYIGGEFLGDFFRGYKSEETEPGTNFFSKRSMSGFVPHLNFKAGYVCKRNVLVYGKIGCAWRKSAMQKGDEKTSKRKPSFVLGAGVEKAFCNKFSAALETDYDFGYNWNPNLKYKKGGNDQVYDKNHKDIGEGWNIRALVKYNVKY